MLGEGMPQVAVSQSDRLGAYHLGVYLEGVYCDACGAAESDGHGCRDHEPQRFARILSGSAAVPDPEFARPRRERPKRG